MNIKYDDIVEPILDELRDFQTCYSKELYMSFKDRFEGLKPKIEASLQEGRALKIGIVGEVKAGKSSFLNALLFKLMIIIINIKKNRKKILQKFAINSRLIINQKRS